ncbi:uncharacterized protein [Halyomorpha halys]|uniref:uncharacterized protein n=1 Tax=Halyomorpha halys TaxID=286706 RepID=UPI0006D4E8DD|nr:uncharacterized protein LOC106685154 [Halyomorpha halys]
MNPIQLLCFVICLSVARTQFVNGRKLEGPVGYLCYERIIHEKFNNTGYYFSWKSPSTEKLEHDWLGARNWCRRRCMDTVSLQTSSENEFIKKRIVEDKVKYIWTSGRLCNFKGCEREDLQPRRVNGWFWTSHLQKLSPATNRSQNDWSNSGGLKLPQPDNREEIQNGAPENCIAILNNLYGDGIHWHDVGCYHKKPFVCEENEALLNYIKLTYGNGNIA